MIAPTTTFSPGWADGDVSATLHCGDCLDVLGELGEKSVNCCVTSPPYFGLRDYGHGAQIGLEQTPEDYVAKMVEVFRCVRRVLRDDGTVWLNLGDSYGGAKGDSHGCKRTAGMEFGGASDLWKNSGTRPKDLIGIPWRVAFALQADGWYLRQDIIWSKPNPMPESVTDRCTKAHEYIFLLSKSRKYFYDADAIAEPSISGCDLGLLRGKSFADGKHVSAHAPSIEKRQGEGVDSRTAGNGTRNRRSVWTVTTKPYKGAHFATFPPDLIEPCILAGCPKNGTVLDPFAGSGACGQVAIRNGRKFVGIELNPEYIALAKARISEGYGGEWQ